MIWDCEKRRQDRNERENRWCMRHKKLFAWFPTKLTNGFCVWLGYYYYVPTESYYGGTSHNIHWWVQRPNLLRDRKREWCGERLTTAEYTEKFENKA